MYEEVDSLLLGIDKGLKSSTLVQMNENIKDLNSRFRVTSYQTGAVATGSTAIPIDDTIPQNTEGNQYMELAITPQDETHKLIIEVTAMFAINAAGGKVTGALFRDSVANALAALTYGPHNSGNTAGVFYLKHVMIAGTTDEITFKFRAGSDGGATITFNGASGSRLFGGVAASSITITEVRA